MENSKRGKGRRAGVVVEALQSACSSAVHCERKREDEYLVVDVSMVDGDEDEART